MTTNTTAALNAEVISAAGDRYWGKPKERAAFEFGADWGFHRGRESAALSTAAAQPPAGWVLVPVKPTDDMIEAADKAETRHVIADLKRGGRDPQLSWSAAYEAMLAVAPKAQATPTPSEWDVRGHLAASLTCWHRLTGQEAAELVALFQGHPAQAAPAAVAALHSGWSFDVKRSDSRVWLTISTPHGSSATMSAAEKTGNGDDTIVAQVLDYLADSLAAPSAVAGPSEGEPLHITHGPLMRHAAALLRLRKPVLPDFESVAAELELAVDGHHTPSGEPSPEWLEVARIAAAPITQAAPQPAELVWDGRLSDTMQKALDALYLECPHEVARDVAFHVRRECEAIYTSYITVKRMYHAARDKLEALEAAQPQPDPFAAPQPAAQQGLIDWVVNRWHDEVANRPLVNIHRRSLDDTWRQVLRHLGVDDEARLGPRHDDLLSAQPQEAAPVAQGDAWRDLCWQIADALECTPCSADEVLPKAVAIAKEAARYRWLRDVATDSDEVAMNLLGGVYSWDSAHADTAIDAARFQQKGGEA